MGFKTIYNHLEKNFEKKLGKKEENIIYPGTILDFCLESLACGMSFNQIKERYSNIWTGAIITEPDLMQIINGHEHELVEKRKKFEQLIHSSLYINITINAMNMLIEDAKSAKTSQQRAQTLSVLNIYLKYFMQTEDNKAMVDTIKQKLTHKDILNFILETDNSEKEVYIRESINLPKATAEKKAPTTETND